MISMLRINRILVYIPCLRISNLFVHVFGTEQVRNYSARHTFLLVYKPHTDKFYVTRQGLKECIFYICIKWCDIIQILLILNVIVASS